MKKRNPVLKWMLAAACAVGLAVPFTAVSVNAYGSYDELYPMNCGAGQYEVAVLTNSGTFDRVACTPSWEAAKNQMYSLGDAGVIRHASSGSATKIINMNNGVVYSYPQRGGKNTANINQFSSQQANMKTTYVTVHREMRWKGLETWNGDGNGNVHVVLTGFDGYISLSDVDLVPMKAVTEDIPLYLGGNDSTGLNEYPFLTHVRQAYYQVERNGNYTDLVYHCFTGWGGNAGSDGYPAEWTFAVGPAPEWMSVGQTYFSDDGTTFYRDRYFSDQAGIYYPYYQFLPLRTQSAVKASTFDSYLYERIKSNDSVMSGKGQVFVDSANTYGMNALLVYAIAILESGNGQSQYARQRNNLFGIAAYDSNPDAAYSFPSVDQCIREEMGIVLRGYTDINDFRFFGPQLGNKGSGVNVKYAGDPYWGMKLAAIAYSIDKCDNSYDGRLTDFNTASIGVIKDDQRVNILKSAGGDILYNSAYGATYQKNHMVSVLSETGGFYKIQSTNALSGGNVLSLKNVGLFPYSWEDAGYLPKAQVTLVNSTVVHEAGNQPTDDYRQNVTLSFDENGILQIKGQAFRPGIYVTEENQLTHSIEILDEAFTAVKTVDLTTKAENDEASFEGSADLSDLSEGTYFFRLSTLYSKLTEFSEVNLLTGVEGTELQRKGKLYRIRTDETAAVLVIGPAECGTGAEYDESTDACVCQSGYENYQEGSGCTIKPEAEELQLYQMMESISYTDEKTLSITGYAFFNGINASKNTDLTHTLILSNQETQEEIRIEAESSSVEEPMDFADGYDYTKIRYTADIDLEELPEGNYALKIGVKNGDHEDSTLVISSRIKDQPDRMINGYLVRVYGRAMANYRIEISKEKNEIDFSLVKKPTRRNSVYAENRLELKDQVLTMDATAFIYNTNITTADEPIYQIVLVDETGKTIRYDAEVYVSDTDPAKLLDLDFDLTSASFRITRDLSDLDPGTYRMYLDIQTKESRDIFEICNLRRKEELVSETEDRTITLAKENTHSRYVLTVTDLSTAH